MTIFQRLGRARASLLAVAATATLALGLAGAPAAAATCSVSSVQTDVGLDSLACVVNVPGGPGSNVTEAEMNGNAVFGKTGWTDLGKIDLPGLSGGLLEITFDTANKTGTWKLKDGFTFDPAGHYALALKGGAVPGGPNGPNGNGRPSLVLSAVNGTPVANAVYLLDISNTSGTWSTADLTNAGGQQPGLSNVTLFGTAAPIPLPAAAWLLIGGIAGLGAVARRRRPA